MINFIFTQMSKVLVGVEVQETATGSVSKRKDGRKNPIINSLREQS